MALELSVCRCTTRSCCPRAKQRIGDRGIYENNWRSGLKIVVCNLASVRFCNLKEESRTEDGEVKGKRQKNSIGDCVH